MLLALFKCNYDFIHKHNLDIHDSYVLFVEEMPLGQCRELVESHTALTVKVGIMDDVDDVIKLHLLQANALHDRKEKGKGKGKERGKGKGKGKGTWSEMME